MPRDLPRVAKLLATVTDGAAGFYLFARKGTADRRKRGRIELPGGHLQKKESPLDGLARELEEEEGSGLLADRVRAARPEPNTVTLSDSLYLLFRLTIPFEDYLLLEPVPDECLGFVLVPPRALSSPPVRSQFTPKTRELFRRADLVS